MATTLDLNGIKTELKSIFDAANTTTSSPIDLSQGLTKRVQKVLTLNPEMIRPQASFYNFVTCYIKDKTVEMDQIAVNQLNIKRESTVTIDVMGAVFNMNMQSVTDDPADTDINYLMENIEMVLRTNPTLNGKVKWQKPEAIRYFASSINQQNNVRVGILTLEAKAYY